MLIPHELIFSFGEILILVYAIAAVFPRTVFAKKLYGFLLGKDIHYENTIQESSCVFLIHKDSYYSVPIL